MSRRMLGLCRDGQWFVYRYEVGQEDDLVEELMRQADDPCHPLGWMEAAELSLRATNLAGDPTDGHVESAPQSTNLPFVKEG